MSPSDPRASSEKLISAAEAQSILDTCDLAARIVREGGTTAVLGEPTLADAVPDLAHTVKALHADVARLRRMIDTMPPWRVSEEPTDEEMRALRLRWAFGPEKYQGDADALIAAVLRGRERIAELTRRVFDLDTAQACQRDRDRFRNEETTAYRTAAETLRAECADLREQLKSTAKDRDEARADVARLTRERDRAVAKVQQLARVITNEATTQDAVELLSAALLQDAASAPNCMEWRGDYNGRAFSIAVQWADGKSPHALIDEARAETERMRAQSDAWRVALLGIIDPLGMRAHPEHTPDDLRSFAVDVIDHRSVQYDELFDENERLQAIVDGSETAPTDEELEAHAKVNGRWRAQTFGELVADCMGPRMAAALRDNDREAGIVRKWWATTEDGTLCARPTAGGGT